MNDYWTQTEYTSIMKKIESWMRDVQRWNAIFMPPVGKNVEHIQNLIGLNNIYKFFLHVGTYIFGPQSETTSFVVKNGPNVLLNFLLLENSLWFYNTHLILLWRIILPMTREYHKIFNHII